MEPIVNRKNTSIYVDPELWLWAREYSEKKYGKPSVSRLVDEALRKLRREEDAS